MLNNIKCFYISLNVSCYHHVVIKGWYNFLNRPDIRDDAESVLLHVWRVKKNLHLAKLFLNTIARALKLYG